MYHRDDANYDNQIKDGDWLKRNEKLVGVIYDEDMLLHEQHEADHCERPDRIKAIYDHFNTEGILSKLVRIPIKLAIDEDLTLIHSEKHV